MTREQRAILAVARSVGLQRVRLVHGGKHPKVIGTTKDGREFCFPYSESPRDLTHAGRCSAQQMRRAISTR